MWMAPRPAVADSEIWVRQLKPSARMTSSVAGGPHGGQQHTFGAGLGYLVVALLESEVAGESAASRVEHGEVDAHGIEERAGRARTP